MPFRILSLLLCLLIAGPMSLPAWALARPETRVGDFFPASPKSASADLDKTLDARWESRGCDYDFASGVCKYLYCGTNPTGGRDLSGNETEVEMLSVTGIQGVINGALGTLNSVYRAYTTAQNILTVVDYARVAYDFISAFTQTTPAGVQSALAGAMQKHFGASGGGDIVAGFQQAFDATNGKWTEIAEAIERKSLDMAQDAAKAMAADAKRIMQTKGRIEPVFTMPTGPGGRVTDRYAAFGKVHIGFSPRGGRLFGFGIMSNTKRNPAGEVIPVLRIDYWDMRTAMQGRPTPTPLHVHYHVGHEAESHPSGNRRTIWP